MAKLNKNPHLAKIHRSYKVDEAADLYQVGKNTVRNWIKQGLPTCDNKRPIFILGTDLNEFHAKRRTKNKQPCKLNQIYCVKCRAPKEPAGGMVDYQPLNEKTGNLVAICPGCESMMYRRTSIAKIEQFSGHMSITLPLAHLHIVESHNPPVNDDFS